MAHAEPYCRCAPKGKRIVPCYRCETCGELRNDAADVHDLQPGDVIEGRVLVGGVPLCRDCRWCESGLCSSPRIIVEHGKPWRPAAAWAWSHWCAGHDYVARLSLWRRLWRMVRR